MSEIELIKIFNAYSCILSNEDKAINYINNFSAPTSTLERLYKIWVTERFNFTFGIKSKLTLEDINEIVEISKTQIPSIVNEKEGLYLDNLALFHGIFDTLLTTAKLPKMQAEITRLRDQIFKDMLNKGTIINSKVERNIHPISLISVAIFGYLNPEDLIVVESLNYIDDNYQKFDGLSLYITALYFLEKGESSNVFKYMKRAKEVSSKELASTFEEIIAKKQKFLISAGEKELLHKPFGNDNPYVLEPNQIVPVFNLVGNTCEFRTNMIPHVEMEVILHINNEEILCSIKEEQDTYYYSAFYKIENLEEYEYFFTYEVDNKIKKTETFNLNVYESKEISSILCYSSFDNIYKIYFSNDENIFCCEMALDKKIKINIYSVPCFPTDLPIGKESINFNEWSIKIDNEVIIKFDNNVVFEISKNNPIIFYQDKNNKIERVSFSKDIYEDESFYGFGERYQELAQNDFIIDSYVYNQYRSQGNRTYMPLPLFLSNLEYGIFVNDERYIVFNFTKNKLITEITLQNNVNFEILLYKGSQLEISKDFTNENGPVSKMPLWAFGPWMSSNNWDRQSIVNEQLELTKKHKIPATVFVLEQWSDEATYYAFNDAQYSETDGSTSLNYEDYTFPDWGRWPNPKQMVSDIHTDGMKLILWQIPISKYMNNQFNRQKENDEKYMIKNQYCVLKDDNSVYRIPEGWFKESLIVDFSNEKGKEWFLEKRKYLLDIGVDGFKTDGGEFVFGNKLKFADGKTGLYWRNKYPLEYIKAFYEFANNNHYENDAITFSRAGFIGAQQFPAHWAGDERSTWEAFRNSLIAGLSANVSGIPYWGWDLGGFNGDIPTAELFVRSAAMACFCPIMQYHAESKGEFNQDRTPWNIAERTGNDYAIKGYKKFADLRMNLIPYIYEISEKTRLTGIPMMIPMHLIHKENVFTNMYDQYYFGEKLLVSPIITENSNTKKMYFPKGEWMNIFTGEVLQEGDHTVQAEIDEIPVFLKENEAFIANVDDSIILGSHIGNNLDSLYNVLITCNVKNSNKQELFDHLGNNYKIDIIKNGNKLNILVNSQVDNVYIGISDNISKDNIEGNLDFFKQENKINIFKVKNEKCS